MCHFTERIADRPVISRVYHIRTGYSTITNRNCKGFYRFFLAGYGDGEERGRFCPPRKGEAWGCRRQAVLEPDQKPGFCTRLVPCISDHCVSEPTFFLANPPRPSFLSPCGRGRGPGGSEGAPGVLSSTGTEHVNHPCHCGGATHALPTNGSHQ